MLIQKTENRASYTYVRDMRACVKFGTPSQYPNRDVEKAVDIESELGRDVRAMDINWGVTQYRCYLKL